MSDIISAKCFGCGHVVKVPSALGGKKARCPKCTNTIVIPALGETSDEIVTDDQLPEVARDGEVLEGELVDPEPEPEPSPASDSRRPLSGAHRRIGAKDVGSARSGTRMGAARREPKRSSSAGLVVGLVLAGLVVVGVVAALALKPKGDPARLPPKAGGPEKTAPETGARTPEDDALEARCREFLSAFNRRAVADVALFYDKEPSGELRRSVGQSLGAEYRAPEFKKVSAAEGITVFVCEVVVEGQPSQGKEIALRWKKVDGEWFIADRP